MASEHLVIQSIVGSIAVDWTKPGKAARSGEAEGERIFALLQSLCTVELDEPIFLAGRAHRVLSPATAGGSGSTQWVETATGDCRGQIVLAPADCPNDRVRIGLNLTKDSNGQSGRLALTFNPTMMLGGPDVHPTRVNARTGKAITSPSSAPNVIEELLRLGFGVLEELYQLLPDKKRRLFAEDTWGAIKRGEVRIEHAEWDAHLTTRDPDRFLQLVTIMFAMPVASGKGAIELATYLGLQVNYSTNLETHDVTNVTLKKLQGKNPLYSLTFSNKDLRVGQMSQNEIRPAVETAAVAQSVRFEIAAHPEGIKTIISRARARLRPMLKSVPSAFGSWAQDFLALEPEATAWWLERAILVLSQKANEKGWTRTSFAGWLAHEMLHGVLRLNVIGGFTREKLEELLALDEKIARAWRADKYSTTSNWAEEIAKQVGCDPQTVYNRRKAWLAEYGVDIDLPYGFYRDLTVLAPTSLTTAENRSSLMTAMSCGDAERTLALLAGAAKDFDRQRVEIVGSTVKGPLGQIPIETVGADTKADAIKARTAALPAPAEKRERRAQSKQTASPTGAQKPARKRSARKLKAATSAREVKKGQRRPTGLRRTKRPSANFKRSSKGRAGGNKRGAVTSAGHSVTVFGHRSVVRYLGDVLEVVLTMLQQQDRHFLADFAEEQGRIRRYVASTPVELYPGKPHLAAQARKIGARWVMGTHYSRAGVEGIIKKACAVAEVRYGTDVVIAFSPRAARAAHGA